MTNFYGNSVIELNASDGSKIGTFTAGGDINAPHLLPLVRAGVLFVDGVQQEREEAVKPRRKAA